MAKYRITLIGLIWVALSLTASIASENIPRITSLDCLNDFQEKMFCSWELTSNSNCSIEFTLYVSCQEKTEVCLDLRNEQFGGSAVPHKCACNIRKTLFSVGESCEIVLESHGESVANTTVYIKSTIKPRAPSNVRVTFQKDQFGVVHWDPGYDSILITDNLSFQVQIISKRDGKVVIEDTITQGNPEYHFSKRQLKRGENYTVRVRTIPVKELHGAWSEWSAEEEWRNDYSLPILDQMDVIIPVSCIGVLCLIIFSYVCLTRYKKKWWDTIPNPANSLIVERKLIQGHRSIPDRKHPATKSCGRFFSRIVKAHKSKCDQLTQHDNVQHYIIDIVSSDGSTFIFEPEIEDIERWVEMHPRREDESNPVMESKPEHTRTNQKAEDHLLEDLAIANMFFSILQDSPSIKMNTFENVNTELMDCSVLKDGVDKGSNFNISGHQTLEYRNYDPDDCPVDCSSNIDAVKMPFFNPWLDNEEGCMPYTPHISIKDFSKQTNGDPSSPGYNCFDNFISETRKDFISDTSKTFCPHNFSTSTLFERTNIYKPQLRPKGILFCSQGDSYQSNIKPKCGQVILQCHESKRDPTSLCQVSGYQSFDQAVLENEPEPGGHMSGYKSFDQAVLQGDETFLSEIDQYQSFDRAVQEYCPGSGYQLSGYKGFDQAVRQGDETFVSEMNQNQSFDRKVEENFPDSRCHLSGYKSFDQAVRQGGKTFVSEMNQYQSFEQAVQENCLGSRCQLSEYKSFDEAVQGDETLVHEVNVSQSFDQAVQQGDQTFVSEMNPYQSFDQAVQEYCPGTGCHLSRSKRSDQTVQEGDDISVHELNVYQSYDQAVQKGETLASKHCFILDSRCKPFESVIGQNNYLDKIPCICKNGHLRDKNCETNTNFENRPEYRLFSSDSMELVYRDLVKPTKENYTSFSDKTVNAMKIAGDTNNDMALKHEGIPLALTFDICEHLRNLKNIHGHKVPLNSENGTNLVNEAIFLCHLVSFVQNQLAFNKNVMIQKCLSTAFGNMPLMPLCDLDILQLSQTTDHLFIQQSSYDKDGNSYMKIK